jgi:hypothetical protein
VGRFDQAGYRGPPDRRGDQKVVPEASEAGENRIPVVLSKFRIADPNTGKHRSTSVGHVGRGIKPIFEEEKQAEDKCCGLALNEEIYGQKQGNEAIRGRFRPKFLRPTLASQKQDGHLRAPNQARENRRACEEHKSGKPRRTPAVP